MSEGSKNKGCDTKTFCTEGFVKAFKTSGDRNIEAIELEIDSSPPFKIETERGNEILFVPVSGRLDKAKLVKHDKAFKCCIDALLLMSIKQSHERTCFYTDDGGASISNIKVL